MDKRIVGKRPTRLASEEGFVVPAVLVAMVIMSVMAVAALRTADDEQRSSRAMRESGGALYAAEAGINSITGTPAQTLGTLVDSLASTLNPGDSSDIGWDTLPNGASHHGVLRRTDAGGQPLYLLTVEGRGASGGGCES